MGQHGKRIRNDLSRNWLWTQQTGLSQKSTLYPEQIPTCRLTVRAGTITVQSEIANYIWFQLNVRGWVSIKIDAIVKWWGYQYPTPRPFRLRRWGENDWFDSFSSSSLFILFSGFFFALICLCFFLKDAKQLERMQKIMVVAMSITLLTGIMLIFATNTW